MPAARRAWATAPQRQPPGSPLRRGAKRRRKPAGFKFDKLKALSYPFSQSNVERRCAFKPESSLLACPPPPRRSPSRRRIPASSSPPLGSHTSRQGTVKQTCCDDNSDDTHSDDNSDDKHVEEHSEVRGLLLTVLLFVVIDTDTTTARLCVCGLMCGWSHQTFSSGLCTEPYRRLDLKPTV